MHNLKLCSNKNFTVIYQKKKINAHLKKSLIHIFYVQIFTNFLSSVMIHATRPFVVNEWIQTKIEGYEVSGTVEVCINCPFTKPSKKGNLHE